MAKKAVGGGGKAAAQTLLNAGKNTKTPIWMYFVAFLIPALLTLIAYAFFGMHPFGERSVLSLDLNGQYVYYFEAIRDAFWGDGSIFYNWGRNLSGEFMGIIGYYLASPFTLIVILLPRTMLLESLMIMQLCKLGTAGLTFFLYARKSKGVKPFNALLFSTMYAMMAYAVIQLIDPMWIDGVVLLPLIALGVEYLIDDGRKLNYIIPLAIMFVANFYIGFMIAIFVALYFVFYLFFGTERKFRETYDYVKIFGRMVLSTAVVLMLSAIMILPVYNALSLGKFDFSEPDYSFKTQFSPIELVPTLLPNQYYSVNMHGKPEIYCGVLTVVLLPIFFLNKKIAQKRKVGYGLLAFALLLSMYIKPIDMLWHGGQTPNWLPYRYSFILSFVLVSVAAEVFTHLDGYKLTVKSTVGTFAGITFFILLFNSVADSFDYIQTKFSYVAFAPYITEDAKYSESGTEFWMGTLLFGIILAGIYAAMLWFYSNARTSKVKTGISCALAAVVMFEAGYNAYDSFKKVDKEVYYSNHDTYYNDIQGGRDTADKLEEFDNSLYRAEKTYSRNVNDNLAIGIGGVSHSSSVMNSRAITFLETMGYSMRSYVTSYDGNTSIADSLLGIKYVFDEPNKKEEHLLSPFYEKEFTHEYINNKDEESQIDVYSNPDALSIGYMADEDIRKLSHLGNDNPFNSQNIFMSTLSGNTEFIPVENGTKIGEFHNYYTRLPEQIELSDCYEEPYGDQRIFKANADAHDPVINIHITAESDQQIYMYLKSRNEKAVNTWISSEKDEDGNFINHESLGSGAYYENHDYSIVRIGSFEPGTEIEVRLTIRLNKTEPDKDEYTIIKEFFFYQFDYDLFKKDIATLKDGQWNITEYDDRYIKGTITAGEGEIMFTTIPSEPGWTVKVDGKKVETFDVIDTFIGIALEPGEHTVEMKYTPPGFIMGIIAFILGLGALVVLYMYDRKNNSVILARIKAKKLAAEGITETTASDKPVAILKSASANKTEEPPAKEKNPQQPQSNSSNKPKGKKKKKKK